MPAFETAHFGRIDYDENHVIEFLHGLPAFEEERRFLALERPENAPVVFLQSLARPDLTFITLPVSLVYPNYRLAAAGEDLETLGLSTETQPRIGAEVLCLAIVTIAEGRPPTANLMAPVLINLTNRCAVQAIQTNVEYSHQHPLQPAEASCS